MTKELRNIQVKGELLGYKFKNKLKKVSPVLTTIGVILLGIIFISYGFINGMRRKE
jgi:hypothetical protein